MFVVDDNTKTITLTKGDTGSVDVSVTGITFEEDDRAVWTVRDSLGEAVFERYYPIEDGGFVIVFGNSDTDHLAAGNYTWDLRFVKNPIWEGSRIVNGDIVATPGGPFLLTLMQPVGEV